MHMCLHCHPSVCVLESLCHYLQTAILGMVYITGIECGLITSGIALDHFVSLEQLGDFNRSLKLLFAGGLVATFFWVSVKWHNKKLETE